MTAQQRTSTSQTPRTPRKPHRYHDRYHRNIYRYYGTATMLSGALSQMRIYRNITATIATIPVRSRACVRVRVRAHVMRACVRRGVLTPENGSGVAVPLKEVRAI